MKAAGRAVAIGSAWRTGRTAAGTLVAVIALWELAGHTALSAVVPTPGAVAQELWTNWTLYPPNIAATLSEAAGGWLIGNVLAILLGCLFMLVPVLESALLRIAIASFCLPIIAIGPILQIAFPGDAPKLIMAALSVFFPTLLGTMLGLRSADTASLELIHVCGGNRWTALRLAGLPFALPSILVALQIAIPAALLGAIIGEYLGGERGLGVAMINAQQTFNLPRMWGFEIVTAGVAMSGWLAAALVCRLATPWAAKRRIDFAAVASGRAASPQTPSGAGAFTLGALARDGTLLVISIGLALAVWQGFIWLLHLDSYFAKTPLDVWRYLTSDAHAAANRQEMWSDLARTAGDALIGYAAGTVGGLIIAVACVLSKAAERALLPLLIAVRVIPLLALTPLIVLVFGRGVPSVVAISGIVTFFPTVFNVIAGLRSVPRDILDMLAVIDAPPLMTLWKVRMRYALPALATSARIAAPGALVGAIVAEWLVTGEGLGSLMLSAAASSRYATLWTAVTVVTLVAVLWYGAVGLIEALCDAAPEWRTSSPPRPDVPAVRA